LDRGEIIIHFRAEEQAKASAVAIVEAKQVVDAKLGGEGSAAKSMENVVLKLKVFTQVVDEAANVTTHLTICIDNSHSFCVASSLHQSCLDSVVLSVQGDRVRFIHVRVFLTIGMLCRL
jgi:hypothetical protein